MPELLLELLSEEIPARMQARAADDLKRLVTAGLDDAGLAFDGAHAYATPRRLALVVAGLPDRKPATKEERKGPQVGAPEQAMKGFLGSLPEGAVLGEREIKGKAFHVAVIDAKGQPAAAVVRGVVDGAMATLPWPKSMRWGGGTKRWVRPLHSILCLFAGKAVPVTLGPVTAGKQTSGHRFMAPKSFTVKGFDDYKAKLFKAKVMLDADERRQMIHRNADDLAKAAGLTVRPDAGLLDEVAGLVEWPVVLMGAIDAEFMNVPAEVLIAAMRGHQKYFSLLDGDGNLAPKFIMVANMETADGGAAIVAGNERVLRARLADARFFWDHDLNKGLESGLASLAGVVFHAKLGSVLEKVDRMIGLAGALAPQIPGAFAAAAERAARLAKADLVSGMVGEFPELQGLMGRYYALEMGETDDVADAIAEHYAPAGPNDACPAKPLSVAVALADKIDTLVGFWAIDEKPTGSKDPFALRRAALGVIRLIIENNLRLSLSKLFAEAVAGYMGQDNAAVRQGLTADDADVATDNLNAWHMPNLLAFFADRLKVHLKEKGVRHDLIDAVFALGEDDLVRVLSRVDALGDFLRSDDGANLLAAYKRAANILKIEQKKDGRGFDGAVDPAALAENAERALFEALQGIEGKSKAALENEDFAQAMTEMARLRDPVDAFFDHVTVNADDPALRENRLRLLSRIRAVMDRAADFSYVEGGDK